MSEVVPLASIRALALRYPDARISTLVRRVERERKQREVQIGLLLSVMAMELRAIVEAECARAKDHGGKSYTIKDFTFVGKSD